MKNKMKFTIILSIYICLLSNYSCQRSVRLNQKQKNFIKIYTELLKLNKQYSIQDSVYLDSSKKIFKQYQFTEKDYEQCLAFFNKKPEYWKVFYENVLIELEQDNTQKPSEKSKK